MLPRNHPDRIQIAFDDPRLVANAGLLLPVTLAQHLGLREVVDSHVDLGDAPGRANPGDKLLPLVASALAGGDFIDDADVLRTGGTAGAIGCVPAVPAAWTGEGERRMVADLHRPQPAQTVPLWGQSAQESTGRWASPTHQELCRGSEHGAIRKAIWGWPGQPAKLVVAIHCR